MLNFFRLFNILLNALAYTIITVFTIKKIHPYRIFVTHGETELYTCRLESPISRLNIFILVYIAVA